jgi:hypothetical protein
MKEIKMFSVAELLLTNAFECNKSKLADFLGVNRQTLRKAKDDTECEKYCVLLIDGKYSFRSAARGQ